MKKVVKAAWSVFATAFLAAAFFLFLITPARAPHGGSKVLGGRTIASLQEQEFDRKLLFYQLCHGVSVTAEKATPERRRVCKAMLVHKLSSVLDEPGAHFKGAIEFRCEDTVFVRSTASQGSSIVLKPNEEFAAIEKAIAGNLERQTVGESTDRFANEACRFLTECKLAMGNFAWRKVASCLGTGDITHRKILLDEIGSMIFQGQENRTKILYADLLERAHK